MELPDILAFFFKDRMWDDIPLGILKRTIHRLHELEQIELLRSGTDAGPAEMLIMWSWLNPDAERRYARKGLAALQPEDLGKEGRLWLIGLSAPGGAEHLTMALGWAAKNLPLGDYNERFRCLAPITPNQRPEPVAFISEGANRGSIKPIHV